MELDSRQAALDSDQEVLHRGPPQLPAYDVASMPGFRFQPTEEELVGFYLRSMVMGDRLEVELINVLNLYRYDPWELPAMAFMQSEREWLFFSPRNKKYPNGARPNRVTASGYWKATGTDRPVRRAHDASCIGLKKTLVFYTGKAPTGRKTEWIMNEYRLPQNEHLTPCCQALQNLHLKSSTTTADRREVALCRIYKKPFQISLISTANFFADNFMTDDPSGSAPHPASPSPKRVKTLAPRNGPFLDTEMDTGSTSTACRSIIKLETDLSSNLYHKYPVIPAPGNLSAQLMDAEADLIRNSPAAVPNFGDRFCASDHVFMRYAGAEPSTQLVDRLSWSDCLTNIKPAGSVSVNQPGNHCPTIASIDRLLKASMWSPLPPPPNLDYATAMMLDGGDDELNGSSAVPPILSSQFVWNEST